jgi:hypothetical protein
VLNTEAIHGAMDCLEAALKVYAQKETAASSFAMRDDDLALI